MLTGHTIRRAWLSRSTLAWALWPLSLIYRGLLWLRRWSYLLGLKQSSRLPVPVVVVGNVIVGGAGKTPTVINLVTHLRHSGWCPGVISRGHGGTSDACNEVTPHSDSAEVGDEPLLIHRATGAPTVVGRDRPRAGRLLLDRHPEVDIIVSDDGMQHWALERDLTVVVFDERGVGNGWLLPAGMLREPWPAKPWGASQMLVLHNVRGERIALPMSDCNTPSYVARRRLADFARAADGSTQSLTSFAPQPVRALAGIAQPEAFFTMLQESGLRLDTTLAMPDHADGAAILAQLEPGCIWLCTEKDAVKVFPLLSNHPDLDVWAVPLEQRPEQAFFAALDKALIGLSSAHGRQTP
jgi:tetraacyldisaccharide 4'-kinase